jgi:hypothetical protein
LEEPPSDGVFVSGSGLVFSVGCHVSWKDAKMLNSSAPHAVMSRTSSTLHAVADLFIINFYYSSQIFDFNISHVIYRNKKFSHITENLSYISNF